MEVKSVLWFRHGLRLHDNPSLLEAIRGSDCRRVTFYPVFIFDGESAGTGCVGYNRMQFLIESLADLDEQFKRNGGPGLYIFRGQPTQIFRKMKEELGINKICYEQDCEPIFWKRDRDVELMCREVGIETVEKVSHTLWNPKDIINANGGYAPLTYQMMLHTINVLGLPSRPVNDTVDFRGVCFGRIPEKVCESLRGMTQMPTPEDFSIFHENTGSGRFQHWRGGETNALEQLKTRLQVEQEAFTSGIYLPNQANIDILAQSTSMSAALRFGCLSVRKFYYSLHDRFNEVQEFMVHKLPGGHHITGQMIWREFFYTMSVENPNYGQMKDNPICLDITWGQPNDEDVTRWKEGKTGIPIIDAAMRQLLAEGWIHHTLRNLVATFLTRTGMWLSWEIGFKHFLKYLLDADWSVCAGNWMWVSSSAFEKLLDSSHCSIIPLAQRLDPNGEYIKRYIPELHRLPIKYIHQPWLAPIEIQEYHDCIIGQNYPSPMIDLARASQTNCNRMKSIRDSLIDARPHVRPSNEDEIRTFFWIGDEITCN